MSKKKTIEQFIAEAKNIHGDKYDYSRAVYIDANTKVTIICPIHGMFFQRPNDHIRGIGCKKCACDKRGKESRMRFSEFLTKAQKVHNNKYKYDESSFSGSHSLVVITCPIHGDFTQKAEKHLAGQGCSKCALLDRHNVIQAKAINDTDVNTKTERSYRVWHNLIDRTLNPKVKEIMPTYRDVTICDEWLTYSNFKKWFDDVNNGYREGYQLDKDILIKGNKVYSPNTCCFVPPEINTLLINRKRFRGEYPIGVSKSNNGKYKATMSFRNTRMNIGVFNSIDEAFNAYKGAKEIILRETAKEYYNDGLITKQVYNALLDYKIEIND